MNNINSFNGKYRFLSNFYPAQVVLDGQLYSTVEHAYQAAKTLDSKERNTIGELSTPGKTKRYSKKLTLRPDWDEVKLGIMEDLVRQKFKHPDLAKMLLDTGDAELVEGNTWGDVFWGVSNGVGQNNLGKILMKIRSELRKGVQ